MALYRETPKCPFCGEKIAEGIYQKLPDCITFVGDTFQGWKYKKHDCEGKRKFEQEMKNKTKHIDFNEKGERAK